jgi:hypothetical protein
VSNLGVTLGALASTSTPRLSDRGGRDYLTTRHYQTVYKIQRGWANEARGNCLQYVVLELVRLQI